MFPPLFEILNLSTAVKDELGHSPLRVYPFSEAPQNPATPYCVWQVITGFPQNYLGDRPDIDSFTTQIDIYATTASAARDGAQAIRDAIEPHAHITAWRGESTEPDTNLRRYSFDVEFLTHR